MPINQSNQIDRFFRYEDKNGGSKLCDEYV